ncbi:MAG: Rpn family recombination-promoting nuclease/putative transposase [Candidatus Rifleibacteriota bacterium]
MVLQFNQLYGFQNRFLKPWKRETSSIFTERPSKIERKKSNKIPRICLWIMGESLIENSEIYNKYLISHYKNHKPLTDLIEYHFVELSKFNKHKPANLRTKFEKWLHLLKFGELYQTLDDLPDELKKEKGISEVVDKMTHANTKENLRELIISREMFLLDMNTEKAAARKEGRQVGIEEGKQKEQEEVARKMLAKGLEFELIVEITGLSLSEIEKLSNQSNKKVSESAKKYKTARKPRKKKK